MLIEPKKIEHKPIREEVCRVILIKSRETVSTGSIGGEHTDTALEYI